MLRFRGLVLLIKYLIVFANWFCTLCVRSILPVLFLITSQTLCIELQFVKLYVVMYPLLSSFLVLILWCSFIISGFSILFGINFFIDADSRDFVYVFKLFIHLILFQAVNKWVGLVIFFCAGVETIFVCLSGTLDYLCYPMIMQISLLLLF